MNQRPRQKRHDRVLRARPDEDVERTAGKDAEIFRRKRHPHRQHDDPKHRSLHIPPHPSKEFRLEKGEHRHQNDEKRRLRREQTTDSK